ncbi:MAG TPA: hypothetical protein VLH75_20060 [Longimicrobiales bacterium]|nr:hypothetical protein [Longimicrobiales bacterium]
MGQLAGSAAKTLAMELYRRGMIKTWLRDKPEGWVLLSGLWSPFYLQLRALPSHPDLMRTIGANLAHLIKARVREATRVVGIATAGVPIATAVSLEGGLPCAYTRKIEGVRSAEALREALSSYGDHSLIEGDLAAGDVVVLVDDLVTRFDSKIAALEMLAREYARRGISDYLVRAVAVVVDREQGALSEATARGVELVSMLQFRSEALEHLRDTMTPLEVEIILEYLDDPEPFQDLGRQESLRTLARAAQ